MSDAALGASHERGLRVLAQLAAALLLAAWIAWGVAVESPRRAVALRAEVVGDAAEGSLHRLGSPVDAEVAMRHVQLGDDVAVGDVLVDFTPGPEAARRRSLRARVAHLEAVIEALEAAAAARRDAAQAASNARPVRTIDDEARRRTARLAHGQAQADPMRYRELARGDLPAADEPRLWEFRARSREVEVGLSVAAQARGAAEAREESARRRTEERRLAADIAGHRSERQRLVAALAALDARLERHRLRAPVAGRVVEAKVLNPGALVAQGEPLLAIAPDPRIGERPRRRLTAYFALDDVLGRMRVGQLAQVAPLDSPHGQGRRIPAAVAAIGDVGNDGLVRVDLITQLEPATDMEALVRGCEAQVLVEVDRRSPWHWTVAAIAGRDRSAASP